MKHFFFRLLPLLVVVCHFACQEASQQKLNSVDTLLGASKAGGDTTTIFSTNIKGDTVSFSNWSPQNEMLGLGKTAFGDLDSMIAREYIRVLVPYSKTYYYIEGMKTYGIAYDMLNLFEKELNKKLNFYPPKVRIIFIPVDRKQAIPLLTAGYADMIAAGYTITPERQKVIDFSEPTITGMKEIVVGGPSAPPISSIRDLASKQVFVRETSSYQASLERLNDSFRKVGLKPVDIEFTDPYLEAEDILEMVNEGMIPYTITSQDLGALWKTVYTNLKVYQNIAIESNVSYGWGFRKNSPKLEAAVNHFLKDTRKGTETGNILYNKYAKNTERLRDFHSPKALADLNSFKNFFQKYGNTYHLDWLLLASQGYQESQLNHKTRSHAGAVGVMQVLPSTAAGPPINIPDISGVEQNINAGVKYMRFLIDRYYAKEQMDDLNKHLFALAAYNAGPANIIRLRREAKAIGLNENEWFNNVEKLAARRIGREPVQYVSNIYRYYRSYHAVAHYGTVSGKKVI
jgi:membrane-bound lytic murein transglycosylase MltF